MLPKNKNKKHGKTKTPTRRLVHENLAKHRVFLFFTKIPPKHKRRTPRGGRRTCYLVVVVVVAAETVVVVVVVLAVAVAVAVAVAAVVVVVVVVAAVALAAVVVVVAW